ncbi:MAG: ABC transporter ATP-binding protein [Bacteroidia bacterium]|nr:ABC transporter ATP-binding protein [Bacteroidia bacterium]
MIFQATDIYKKFTRSSFVLNVPQMELAEGTITGVVGENGNGKTTLLNIVAGELEAEGSLSYFDHPINQETDWGQLKLQIAFIPQRIPRWYGSLIQNLALKAALDGIPADEIDTYLDEILDFLGLLDYKHLKWTEISTGYRLRFELARMLIGKPRLLVLDEPLANLDINTQQKFLSDLKNILKDKSYPTAVILSSQQLHEIETVSDQMIFLRKGQSVFSGAMNDIGADQDSWAFELQVIQEDKENLMNYLKEKSYETTTTGEYVQVTMEKRATENDFLRELINQNLTITYYRNITRSTKRLFNQ